MLPCGYGVGRSRHAERWLCSWGGGQAMAREGDLAGGVSCCWLVAVRHHGLGAPPIPAYLSGLAGGGVLGVDKVVQANV